MKTGEMKGREIYPIGQQDFKTLRESGALYVDKTQFIDKILESGNQYFFLARPRRFGKSLFLSTLKYFFEGERSLFKGLYIDSTNWHWDKFPVLYLDLNSGEYSRPGSLDEVIEKKLGDWETKYDVEVKSTSHTIRFQSILETIHEKTGRQAVILVDEYDKPLVKNLNNDDFELYRRKLAALYSNLKTGASHIRMVFLTGVSRFSKLSVFSDLNNLNDISFDNDYADICGVAEHELKACFKSGIQALADEYEISYDEACERLKMNYDGYRFARKGSDIYNPWSLFNCLQKREIANYWNSTGFPSIIAEMLQRIDADIEAALNVEYDLSKLMGLDLKSSDPVALLYQTGYITIKDYDPEFSTYKLGVPNREVREGLFDVLLPYYVKAKSGNIADVVFRLVKSVRTGDAEEFMKNLQAYFAGIPYNLQMDNENNFHNAFYILMTLLDLKVQAEAYTSDGRMDLLLKSKDYIYIIELKYDGSAQAALDQINEKRYDLKFYADSRKLIKIGVNFSSRKRRIDDWIIEM